MHQSWQASRRQPGFTLIEILVVMSLLAMVMVAMASSLRTMAQTEAKVADRLQRTDQIRVTRQFLTQVLGRIVAERRPGVIHTKDSEIKFTATESQLNWIGIMPARYGMGGRTVFNLTLEPSGSGQDLILRYAAWFPGVELALSGADNREVLARNILRFAVSAQGLPVDIQKLPIDWPKDWQTGWPVRDQLPQRIRIDVSDQLGQWPPVVVNLTSTLQSQARTSGFVSGGS